MYFIIIHNDVNNIMDFQNPIIRQHLKLGLCCVNTILREQKIFCSRTCNRKNFTVKKAQEKALQNINDMIKMIEWNHTNHISCFRISSDIFPHFTDNETEPYTIDFARDLLKKAGDLANLYGQRIVMHPGQFNQVGAENPIVFDKTIADLTHHANILDVMGIDHNGVLIVHGGGVYKSKQKTMSRWIDQFRKLPNNVQHRLVIENCEKNYCTEDCLEIANTCGIPCVFDFHHYQCWKNPQKTIHELIPDVIKTWQTNNKRILMHTSDQDPNRRLGAHHNYVEKLPNELFELILQYHVDIDLEIEAKMKEQAIFKLYNKYNFYEPKPPITKIKIKFKKPTPF